MHNLILVNISVIIVRAFSLLFLLVEERRNKVHDCKRWFCKDNCLQSVHFISGSDTLLSRKGKTYFLYSFIPTPIVVISSNMKKICLVCILQSGISCVQLDWSMTRTARDSAITKFANDPSCIIFFMSMKAGGLALNLTATSQVIFSFPLFVNVYSTFLDVTL